jgi:hypothetical protein
MFESVPKFREISQKPFKKLGGFLFKNKKF